MIDRKPTNPFISTKPAEIRLNQDFWKLKRRRVKKKGGGYSVQLHLLLHFGGSIVSLLWKKKRASEEFISYNMVKSGYFKFKDGVLTSVSPFRRK